MPVGVRQIDEYHVGVAGKKSANVGNCQHSEFVAMDELVDL